MSDELKKVLDKLAKIKAKEENCRKIGSIAEAEAFAQKLQALLIKHELGMTDLDFSSYRKEAPVDTSRIVWAHHGLKTTTRRNLMSEMLADTVSKAQGCRILVHQGSNIIYLVGREANRRVAEYLIGRLTYTMQTLSLKEYDKEWYQVAEKGGEPWRMKGWKAAWMKGFVLAIHDRLRKANETPTPENTCTAVMRINTELADANKFVEDMNTKNAERIHGQYRHNRAGEGAGYAAGSEVSLNTAIDSSASRAKLEA